MKVDVVINYYRKAKEWPFVLKGLEDNKECINNVIVVNDELWGDGRLSEGDMAGCIKYLEHPHDGFGVARSVHQGVEAVETEYICNIDADVIMTPGSLKKNLSYVESELLILGTLHDVGEAEELHDIHNPEILRRDWRAITPSTEDFRNIREGWWIARKEDYQACGGHDRRMKEYGMIDYVFALRWMTHFDRDSYWLAPGVGYHIGGIDTPEQKATKKTSPGNIKTFDLTYKKFLEKEGLL